LLRHSVDSHSLETLIPSTIPKIGLPDEDPSTKTQTNSMTMDSLKDWIPDLEYREFMVELSEQITAQDLERMRYMLTSKSLFPAGIMERLDTGLKLFVFLEQILFVGPNNLMKLQELFRTIRNPKLCEMVTNYIRGCRTAESFAESAVRMSNTATLVADPGQKGTAS
jgi:hypothetical protein